MLLFWHGAGGWPGCAGSQTEPPPGTVCAGQGGGISEHLRALSSARRERAVLGCVGERGWSLRSSPTRSTDTVRVPGLSPGAPDHPSTAPGSLGRAGLSPGFVFLHRTSWGCGGSLGSFSCRCTRRCGGSERPGQHRPCACPAPSPCSCGGSGSAALLPVSLVTPRTDFSVSAQRCVTSTCSQPFPFELEIRGWGSTRAPKLLRGKDGAALSCFPLPVRNIRILPAQRRILGTVS